MKRIIIGQIFTLSAGIMFMTGCRGSVCTIEVSNPLDFDRHQEMVELKLDSLISLPSGDFVLKDSEGREVGYQVTYDGRLIFPVSLAAGQTMSLSICEGTPAEHAVKACGAHYPGRDNDFAWENDLVGFRTYGHKNDVAAGYDLFAKRGTDLPVLHSFYETEVVGSEAWDRYYELMKTDAEAAFRFKIDSLSYHVDHGYGMDCYAVGPTLGAGVAALVDEGDIVYPYCYETYEILDNGPLRFSVKFTYRPFSIGSDGSVTETRIITLDAGSHLNRTSVSYEGLSESKVIVTGIVLQDKDGHEVADAEKGFISYPAPTQNADTTKFVDNGTLFVGHAFPEPLADARTVYFSDGESSLRNGSKGHVLAFGEYEPGSEFSYYWGFGWDHADMASYEEWLRYLETFALQVRNPLTVTIR